MTKMQQEGTDKGERDESGEREPKRSTDSDTSGERHGKITGGVAMGKADALTGRTEGHAGQHDGNVGEVKGERGERHFYKHKKDEYRPGKY